jgi:hypothetical protein
VSPDAVILIAAGTCIIALVAWVVIAERLDPPPADPEPSAPRAAAAVLASGTGQFPMLDPDPEPDPTGIQPHDVRYLGKPSGEWVADLFPPAGYVDDLFAEPAGGES